MTIKNFGFLLLPAMIFGLSSCLGDDEYETYEEWMKQNLEYISNAEAETGADGKKVYEKIVPAWDKASFTLMRWHNDRALTASNLTPLDNSTIKVKYLLTNIEGATLDSSYRQTDSLYQCRPCDMITGFWIATTNMHVGDSVTAVIPYQAGYGITGSNAVLPFSTLIFQIKLNSIVALESQPK